MTYLEALKNVCHDLPRGLVDAKNWKQLRGGLIGAGTLAVRLLLNILFIFTFPILAWLYVKDDALVKKQREEARTRLLSHYGKQARNVNE